MSEYVIKDGTGSGKTVKVDSENRLNTNAITFQRREEQSLSGQTFNINTGLINLTSDNKTALLYVINNNTNKNMIVSKIVYLFGSPANGTGDSLVTVLRNPTTGSIITNAVQAEIITNRNFGSSEIIGADVYKGADTYTFNDGEKIIESIYSNGATRSAIDVGNVIIPKSKSLGVEYTPPTGTTSQNVEIALEIFLLWV